MRSVNSIGFVAYSEAFSIATLILARLRRLSGRVIDVTYLIESKDYARYVVDLSLAISDVELNRQALRLQHLLDIETSTISNEIIETQSDEPEYVSGATEEEIYRAQVSHHYIGALR